MFHNQGKVYEIYAQNVHHSVMFGFIEVEKLLFGEKTSVVVDPTEENLKNELSLNYNDDIYVVFEAPNYKVRMGNFIDRKHAEQFRQTLVNSGYL